MVGLIVCILLVIVSFISFLTMLFHWILSKKSEKHQRKTKKAMIISVSSAIITIIILTISQKFAHTPTIEGPHAISELREVTLNGRKEWISIRGVDKNNPLLLFLAGGPGGTQMASFRHNLGELEKHFTVVNWEQPGSGKSYYAINSKTITKETYIQDAITLTKNLLKEFNQEKIFLMGESWGSALGIMIAKEAPEFYHCFIGTGQMVNFLETEKIDYQYAIDLATKNNDTKLIDQLKKQGPPPYYGNWIAMKVFNYLRHVDQAMFSHPQMNSSKHSMMTYLNSSEYGILDKAAYFFGLIDTFSAVYQTLYDIDLAQTHSTLDIPIYFLLGKLDLNAPLELSTKYYEKLHSPHKELIWFHHSGHNPWMTESELFIQEVLKIKDQLQK